MLFLLKTKTNAMYMRNICSRVITMTMVMNSRGKNDHEAERENKYVWMLHHFTTNRMSMGTLRSKPCVYSHEHTHAMKSVI